jgi:hypothetical protein
MATPTVPRFEEAMWIAGYYMSIGVHFISMDEGAFQPLGGSARDGRTFVRSFEAERLEVGLADGRTWLESNPDKLDRAVLVYDGFYNLPDRKIDALIAEIVDYATPRQHFKVALPYRHVNSSEGFALHRPKFIYEADKVPDDDLSQALGQAFMEGREAYEEGSEIWERHKDESL